MPHKINYPPDIGLQNQMIYGPQEVNTGTNQAQHISGTSFESLIKEVQLGN